MNSSDGQRGFTLPETLISAAIAAGVIAAASTSLSSSLTAARISNVAQISLIEVQNLSAQLKSGLPLDDISNSFPSWNLEQSIIHEPNNNFRSETKLVKITATNRANRNISFSIVKVESVKDQ